MMLRTFIDLGPSYVKLGQWLSTRADMMPLPYLEELAKLQDDVPPAGFDAVRPIIEEEIGKIEQVFDSFNPTALSGASLGQVYLARYRGRDVIVKVSRPDIAVQVERDIYVMQRIIPLATRFVDSNLRFSVEGMLSQFIETIHEEMDYRIEAKNLITIKKNLADYQDVIIPAIYPELCSKHVLTMEYLPGVKITDVEALDAMGVDRKQLIVRVHRLFFTMLLRYEIFHADPHPGNISISKEGSIILYDFGMVGRLDDQTRLRLIRLYLALVNKDTSRTVSILVELGTLEHNVDRFFVEKAVDMSIQSMYGKEVDKMEVKALMELANRTMSKFPFRLPKNLALYMRMASILEGIYLHHKVDFQFVKVLADLLKEEGLVKEAYIEEIKVTFMRFVKGVESAITLAPLIHQSLQEMISANAGGNDARKRNNPLLAYSILSAGLFVGSVLALPYNTIIAYSGIVGAAAAFFTALVRKK